jgi:hypothetical protein
VDQVRLALWLSFQLDPPHAPEKCGAAYASFKGGDSSPPDESASAAYGDGGHALWRTVEATHESEALALLPHFVVEGTTVTKVA